MTNPRTREQNRAVRAYQREHPGTTLDQARQAVADRAGRQPDLPARISAAPLPLPAERLDGYVKRVATAAGVQRHRAMELLGLQPGTSATERLDHLADSLPDHTVQALTAATGMTAAQARALTAPRPARPDLDAVRRTTEANLAAGQYPRGGTGKTSTSVDLAAALALTGQRARMIDLDAPGSLEQPAPAPPFVPMADLEQSSPGLSPWIVLDPPPVIPLSAATRRRPAAGLGGPPPRRTGHAAAVDRAAATGKRTCRTLSGRGLGLVDTGFRHRAAGRTGGPVI